MTILPILFTFDQSLEMPAGVCMSSLLEQAALFRHPERMSLSKRLKDAL